MSDITKEQVVEWLSAQSVLEVADLVKELEEKWGVSAAAPVAVAAAGAGCCCGGAPAAEEKDEFDVILNCFRWQQDRRPLKKSALSLDWALKEAKELVEERSEACQGRR